MRLENGKIVRTVEKQIDPKDIEENIRKVRLKRERLREKLEGFKRHDAELKAYEDKLRNQLDTVGLDCCVDELPGVDFTVPEVPEKLSEFLDVRGHLRTDLVIAARQAHLARKPNP